MKISELYRLLRMNGWRIVRDNGPRVLSAHPDRPKERPIPVGKHGSQEVPKGTLNAILKMAGLK